MTTPRAQAFTLLEVLVVITIIGVLTSLLVVNFQGVRERQELALLADQAQALLQQAQAEVRSGKVVTDESDVSSYLCLGAYFEEGERPLYVSASYDSELQTCDMDTLETEQYGISTGSASVGSIEVEGSTYDDGLYVLFAPPEAELLYYDGASLFDGEGSVVFSSSSEELSTSFTLSLSSQTGLVNLSLTPQDSEDEE